MKKALSERQKKILEFLAQFTRENRYPPSLREIGKAVGISSTSVVNYNLNILEREGYIERDPLVSRGIKMVGSHALSPWDPGTMPLLGRIAAGQPIPVPQDEGPPHEMIEVARDQLKSPAGIYALEVKGDSMIDALVNDGDIVLMRHQETAENGEMVAVWLKDREETTLKRFYQQGKQVRLQPANPTLEPILEPAENVEIQGKVVMVIRHLSE